jgi:hypothetical protein
VNIVEGRQDREHGEIHAIHAMHAQIIPTNDRVSIRSPCGNGQEKKE